MKFPEEKNPHEIKKIFASLLFNYLIENVANFNQKITLTKFRKNSKYHNHKKIIKLIPGRGG